MSELTLAKIEEMVEILNRTPCYEKDYSIETESYFYRIGTIIIFYHLDLFIGHPLARYYKDNMSKLSWEDKPKPYKHPFEKFKTRR